MSHLTQCRSLWRLVLSLNQLLYVIDGVSSFNCPHRNLSLFKHNNDNFSSMLIMHRGWSYIGNLSQEHQEWCVKNNICGHILHLKRMSVFVMPSGQAITQCVMDSCVLQLLWDWYLTGSTALLMRLQNRSTMIVYRNCLLARNGFPILQCRHGFHRNGCLNARCLCLLFIVWCCYILYKTYRLKLGVIWLSTCYSFWSLLSMYFYIKVSLSGVEICNDEYLIVVFRTDFCLLVMDFMGPVRAPSL